MRICAAHTWNLDRNTGVIGSRAMPSTVCSTQCFLSLHYFFSFLCIKHSTISYASVETCASPICSTRSNVHLQTINFPIELNAMNAKHLLCVYCVAHCTDGTHSAADTNEANAVYIAINYFFVKRCSPSSTCDTSPGVTAEEWWTKDTCCGPVRYGI